MQKLKFKTFEVNATALLTREQLRNVMGKGSVGQQCSSSNPGTCGTGMICDANGHCAYDNSQTCPDGYFYLGGYCHKDNLW